MKIWKLSNDGTVRINVTNFEENYYKYFNSQFDGVPVKEWGDVGMEIYKGKGKKVDNLYFASGVLIFSMRAVDLLLPLMESAVEVKPLIHEPYPIAAINVLNVIDAIDRDNVISRTLGDGTVVGYEKYAFIEEKVANQHIFKIPRPDANTIFVSDRFRDCVLENKLKGFRFHELWDSNAVNHPPRVIEELVIEDSEALTYQEAMELVERGEAAVMNAQREKWQKNKKGKIRLGILNDEGTYVWMEPVCIPIPHLFEKWIVTEKSDV